MARTEKDRTTGLVIEHCVDWDDFVRYARTVPDDFLFRGHAREDWRLQSELDRVVEAQSLPRSLTYRKQVASRALADFRERASATLRLRPNELTDDEWMALARQHGMVTPFLDWTKSPFVSAFFAFSELGHRADPNLPRGAWLRGSAGQDRVAVWGFNRTGIQFEELKMIELLPWANARQAAQRGAYTLLESDAYLDLESYIHSQSEMPRLIKWTIPASEFQSAMGDLERMNITWSTLFSDLTGAALTANSVAFR